MNPFKSDNPLLTFNFDQNPFDGDPRQAHQLIPFIQGKLGAAQLSYILNLTEYPDPHIPDHTFLLEQQHRAALDAAATEYRLELEQ